MRPEPRHLPGHGVAVVRLRARGDPRNVEVLRRRGARHPVRERRVDGSEVLREEGERDVSPTICNITATAHTSLKGVRIVTSTTGKALLGSAWLMYWLSVSIVMFRLSKGERVLRTSRSTAQTTRRSQALLREALDLLPELRHSLHNATGVINASTAPLHSLSQTLTPLIVTGPLSV